MVKDGNLNKKNLYNTFVCFFSLLYIRINLYSNNSKVSNKDLYSSSRDSKKEYDTLENIQNNSRQVVADIEAGVYSNLLGKKINVIIPDENEICNKVSEYREWKNYNGITDTKEMLDYELNLIQFFLGSDLNSRYLIDGASPNEDFDAIDLENRTEEYPVNNYKKVCKMMEDGTYISWYDDEMPRLGYSSKK